MLVTGYWLLVAGCWLLVTGWFLKPENFSLTRNWQPFNKKINSDTIKNKLLFFEIRYTFAAREPIIPEIGTTNEKPYPPPVADQSASPRL